MVSLETIHKSNALISTLPAGLVALFLGATSGIGQSTLLQLATHAQKPRIYIVARPSSPNTTALLQTLKEKNPSGTYTLISADVSLVRETSSVVSFIKQRETKLDLLFASIGFISFTGRHETSEGLDPTMTTRYYTRIRMAQLLLPLLNAAPHPRVVSILAGGHEGSLNLSDLDLREKGNYSIVAAATHSATMLTLSYEHLARENPRISFVHAFPRWVATGLFSRGSEGGMVGWFMRGFVQPLTWVFATPVEEAGARGLFYCTSDRYSVAGEDGEGVVPLVEGVEKSATSGGGVFLSSELSESIDNEKVLKGLRDEGVGELVWKHTEGVFERCSGDGDDDTKA